jgi:hypothetical protein
MLCKLKNSGNDIFLPTISFLIIRNLLFVHDF